MLTGRERVFTVTGIAEVTGGMSGRSRDHDSMKMKAKNEGNHCSGPGGKGGERGCYVTPTSELRKRECAGENMKYAKIVRSRCGRGNIMFAVVQYTLLNHYFYTSASTTSGFRRHVIRL